MQRRWLAWAQRRRVQEVQAGAGAQVEDTRFSLSIRFSERRAEKAAFGMSNGSQRAPRTIMTGLGRTDSAVCDHRAYINH